MLKRGHSLKVSLLILGDLILFYAALFGALFLRQYYELDTLLVKRHLLPFSIIFLLWLVIFGAFGFYDLRFMKNSKVFLYRLLRVMATNAVVTILVLYLIPIFEIEPRRNLFLITGIATIYIFLWRYLFNLIIIRTHAPRVIFFGVNREMVELADFLLKNPQLGQRPVAFVSNGESRNDPDILPLPHYQFNQNLDHILRDTGADTIVITSDLKGNKTLVRLLFQVIPLGISVAEFPQYHEMLTGKIPLSLIGEVWFLENLIGIRKKFYEFFKRIGDVALATLLGIPTLLLLPFIALAIKLDSEGPTFYRQKRVGRHGKDFWLIKYRSMVKDAENLSGQKEAGRDPRHTRTGRFLRKSYLDELPQIINILKGEMSFVGPRPERPHYVAELKQKIPFYEMRLLIPPGLTGWAQVNMENDASVEDAPEKMQYDLYYTKNRSALLDFLIIIKTLFALLHRTGR
ncbi:MAG: sugar transferase [Candidatus Sungiibacteriota bacterium]|uniref:Sugar transferase n=1 Tax=Candidatus Sungiibacteriota bacterium TaxID=2750080 RepID=A0A7T5UQL4_9BACT|nr:MAG: sugar transferase [Candidatus Sungbacteria bacterium]